MTGRRRLRRCAGKRRTGLAPVRWDAVRGTNRIGRRVELCDTLEASLLTSARQRLAEIEQGSPAADRPLAPIARIGGLCVLQITQALARLGYRPETWTRQVLAVESEFNRAIGAVECLVEKASAMGQCWLRGIARAWWLATR